VLLVDDQPANLLALEAVLDGLNLQTVGARSGEEALAALEQGDFAAILLDVHMEGLDGFETARQIRAREASRHTPILFLTALDASTEVIARAYELGAVDFLTKPVVPVMLRAKVQVFVELFEKTRQVERQADELHRADQREAREALEEYRRIVETANEGIWTLDADACVTFVNQRMAELLGCQVADIVGRGVQDFTFAEDLPRFHALWDRRRAGVSEQADVRFRHASGREVWVLMAARPLLDDRGQFRGALDMFTDVTDRRRAEDALREADRRKDEFLAMLAHELRNPLAPIRNALEILRLRNTDATAAQRARDMMERQVQQLVRLVDDLLDVSRITRDRIELRREQVDLRQVVERGVETVQPAIKVAGHELVLDLPNEPLIADIDAVRMAQVLANLLSNAAKYTEGSGRIAICLRPEGDAAVLCISDNGIGIKPELLPHIFDLFVQGDRSIARTQGGLGIGLTLVKKLVEMHGGTVQANSAGMGSGSEFIIRLPLGVSNMASLSPGADLAPARHRRHILVVDDNVDAAESLTMLLRLMNHQVCIAHDGPSAIEAARKDRPDVVLLDIGLPVMDGYEVARRLREIPALKGTQMVAVTGYGQDEDRRRALECGFHQHLTKPVDLAVLQALLS
jgi:PAS domain S-box-containing protein